MKKTPKFDDEMPNIPDHILDRFPKRSDSINVFPAVALQALEVAKNAECSIQEFVEIVERDIKLATDILRFANCVMFNPVGPITNLRNAVTWLGFRQCKNLILTSCLASIMKRVSLDQEWIREALWRHSYTTARLSLHLRRALELPYDGEEFCAGLIHDAGRFLLASVMPEKFMAVDPLDFDETLDVLKREQEHIGTDHCQLGKWFGLQNGMPDALTEVMALHHEPAKAQFDPVLVALVATADQMANYIQRGLPVDEYDLSMNPASMLLKKSASKKAVGRFESSVRDILLQGEKEAAELAVPSA